MKKRWCVFLLVLNFLFVGRRQAGVAGRLVAPPNPPNYGCELRISMR